MFEFNPNKLYNKEHATLIRGICVRKGVTYV